MTTNIQKTYHIRNIAILFCAFSCLICYDIFGGLWLKGVTSGWFVLLALVNLGYARKQQVKDRFLILVTLGLFAGMCADVLLGIQFILGVLAFALGHILYLAAFFTLEKPKKKDLLFIVPAALFSMFFVAGTPFIQINDPMLEKLLLGYAVIISGMLGKAVSNLDKTVFRRLLMLGGFLFWFSDLVLAVDMFGTGSRLTWILCSYAYWPAQNILAYSLFHFVNRKRGESPSP